MRYARLFAVLAATLVLAAPAAGTTGAVPPAPAGLHAFLLRADEPLSHTFGRTPSFAWLPAVGAERYEFELANSPTFNEGSIVWSDATLKTPAASIPWSLPWMTGSPYALYAHVRAWTADGAGPWSSSFGFNMRWASLPRPVPTYPGLLSWATVPGATSYDVWLVDAKKVVSTRSNVADEREYYDFHQQAAWSGLVHWRVRAVRNLYGSAAGLPNGLPAVTYGPWSKTYTSANPVITTGPIRLTAAFSDVTSSAAQPEAHRLTPAFAFTGNQALDGTATELYRAYVFTDSDCVNVVFRSAIIGSPAYAPRTTGPAKLPVSQPEVDSARTHFLPDGIEPQSFMADTAAILPTEMDKPSAQPATDTSAPAAPQTSGSTGSSSGSDTGAPATPSAPGDPGLAPTTPSTTLPSTPKVGGAPVDLWDSGWPNGRYFWTVVPVKEVVTPSISTALAVDASAGATSITVTTAAGFPAGASITVGSGASADTVTIASVTGSVLTLSRALGHAHSTADVVVNPSPAITYVDAELPQDVCAAGRVATFGKVSEPVLAGSTSPYASGLSPTGRLIAAVSGRPTFYGTPLVAWQPTVGADEYQVQWSKTKYPWQPIGQRYTFATSALLDQVAAGKRVGLTPGTWYYRVRGLDFSLPGTARAMSWSDLVGFVVAKPTFKVIGNTTLPKAKPSTKKRTSPAASGTYTNKTYGYSLALPSGWHASKSNPVTVIVLPGNPVITYSATDGSGFVGVAVGSGRGTASFDEWVQTIKVQLLTDQYLVGPPTFSSIKLPAGQAEKVSFTESYSNVKTIQVETYALSTATRSWYVIVGAPPAKFAAESGALAQLAQSFALSH